MPNRARSNYQIMLVNLSSSTVKLLCLSALCSVFSGIRKVVISAFMLVCAELKVDNGHIFIYISMHLSHIYWISVEINQSTQLYERHYCILSDVSFCFKELFKDLLSLYAQMLVVVALLLLEECFDDAHLALHLYKLADTHVCCKHLNRYILHSRLLSLCSCI